MGRNSYYGGSTVIRLTEDGTAYPTRDDVAPRSGRRGAVPRLGNGASKTLSPKKLQEYRINLLHRVIDSELAGTDRGLSNPKKVPIELKNEITSKGGLLNWARQQRDYSILKQKKAAKKARREAEKGLLGLCFQVRSLYGSNPCQTAVTILPASLISTNRTAPAAQGAPGVLEPVQETKRLAALAACREPEGGDFNRRRGSSR